MLHAYGIRKFHLPVNHVATACLKACPEDFLVAEVDVLGERTDLSTYRLPPPRGTPDCGGRSDDNAESSATVPPALVTATACGEAEEVDVAKNVPLLAPCEEVLTSTMEETLRAVFGDKSDIIERYSESLNKNDSPFVKKDYLMTVLNSKDMRRRLHIALKVAFPHLRAETRRASSLSEHKYQDNGDCTETPVFCVTVTYNDDYLLIAHVLGERAADAVAMWCEGVSKTDELYLEARFPSNATKDVRRAFHEALMRRYTGVSCRVSNGKIVLRSSSGRGEKRRRSAGKGTIAVFTHLLIRKRNLDMIGLRLLLSEHYGVPPTTVCTAGLKDKCAVTYQRCSVPGFQLPKQQRQWDREGSEALLRLSLPDNPTSYVEVLQASGPYDEAINIGQLKGNWFVICLRHVHGITPLEFVDRVRRVEVKGFLNYFGEQRFSEGARDSTDHVGLHILCGRWVEAVRCVLSNIPGLYESFPAHMEPRHVPRGMRDQLSIVQALHRAHRTGFRALSASDVENCTPYWQELCHDALLAVPYTQRALWLNAVQSLIFNCMLSRLKEHELPGSLPLMGYTVELEETLEPVLDATLLELNVGSREFLKQKKVLGVPLPGAMRRTVVCPEAVSVELHPTATDQLASEEDGFSATLSFFLPPSSYATVFLREVLGCDMRWAT
ncbi:hypothetical protein TRVL_02920 [Trypanosoma vivax]|nr:hypothetical protein TRVL_02920 [Trypanosoma vivax]